MEKKAKAEAKRTRRIKRKQGGDASDSPETPNVDSEASDVDPEAPNVSPEASNDPN